MADFATIENTLQNMETIQEAIFYIHQTLLENANNEKHLISYFKKRLMCTLPESDYTMHLLWHTMQRFSKETVDENIITWMELVLKQEANYSGDVFNLLKCSVNYCGKSHDRHKSAVASLIPSLLNKCLSVKKGAAEVQSLNLMKYCFTYFPSACGPLKAKAEKFILRYLNTPCHNTDLGEMAAKCFPPILQSGPSGTGSIIHQENWKNAFNTVCNTLINVNDNLLSTGYTVVDAPDTYPLDPLPEDCSVFKSITIAGSRLHLISQFLKEMIRCHYRTPKVLKLQKMLDVLENAFQDKNEMEYSVALNSIRLDYKLDIVNLLRYFVVLMSSNLIMISDKLMNLIIAEQNKTRQLECHKSSLYKCLIYDLLSIMVSHLGNNFDVIYHEKLINIILEDITPPSEGMQLTVPSSRHSPRKRQKLLNEQTIAYSNKSRSSDNSICVKNHIDKIYVHAVQCLTECMTYVSLELKAQTQKKLYETILNIINSIENGNLAFPCSNAKVHHVVYSLLAAYVEQIHPAALPDLVSALNMGKGSTSPHVHVVVSKALKRIRDICIPSQEPLVRPRTSDAAENSFNGADTHYNFGSVMDVDVECNESHRRDSCNLSTNTIGPEPNPLAGSIVITLEDEEINNCTVADSSKADEYNSESRASSDIFCSQDTENRKMTIDNEDEHSNSDCVDLGSFDMKFESEADSENNAQIHCSQLTVNDMLASLVP